MLVAFKPSSQNNSLIGFEIVDIRTPRLMAIRFCADLQIHPSTRV